MHTSGPWKVYIRTIRQDICDPGLWIYADNPMRTVVDTGAMKEFPLSDDDARLIAAAPELLQALDDCITNENCTAIATCDVAYMIRRFKAINKICRSAIAKVEGEPCHAIS